MNTSNALFVNGVYEGVFAEILEAGIDEAYLQPHSGRVIRMLQKDPPTPEDPVKLYASTTGELSRVSYAAEVIRWEYKRELSRARHRQVSRHLREYQPQEVDLFRGKGPLGDRPVNLLTIRALQRLDEPFSTSLLIKESDSLPLKPRTQSGGWSPVRDDAVTLDKVPAARREALEDELRKGVERSHSLSDRQLNRRLASASKVPPKVQVISVGYRRNPDVIVTVLRRAKGHCEECSNPAPFNRRSDGSPYLEVHHSIPLSEGGEDTVENAMAVCPNCHREAHYGPE